MNMHKNARLTPRGRSFDHVVGASNKRRTHVEPEPKVPATL